MDIQQLFASQFEQLRKQDQAKYFLVKVQSVKLAPQDPDSFLAVGTRVDNNQRVAIFSKKSSSGQHLPEAGGVLRADKVSRLPTKSSETVTAYKAEYFHTYRNDDFCVRAIVQAQRPKKDQATGIWNADLRFFDPDKGGLVLNGTEVESRLQAELVKMLKPWAFDEKSAITHDVSGKSLWGNNQAKPGITPLVAVRSNNKTFYVYGTGAVKDESAGDIRSYKLPDNASLIERVNKSMGVTNLLSVIRSISQSVPPEKMAELKISLIPGLQVRVGKESVASEKPKYLAVPDAFEWKNRDVLDENDQPVSQPGFRLADVHIKQSRTGTMMVVDAAPSAGGRLTQFIPESNAELEDRLSSVTPAPVQAPAATPTPTPAPVNVPVQTPVTQAVRNTVANSPLNTPAINKFDDAADLGMDYQGMEEMESFGDFDQYASDLSAMQAHPAHLPTNDFDTSIDDLLEEAADRQAKRFPRPGM